MTAEKEVTLQFQAPRQPGVYKYKLVIRSDSYLDCDRVQQLNVYVVPSTVLGERKNAEEEWGTISSEGSDNEHGDDRACDSDSSYRLFEMGILFWSYCASVYSENSENSEEFDLV